MTTSAALSDMGLLTFAVLVAFVPGGLLVFALGQFRTGRRGIALAIAPVVTAGVAYLTAILTGLLGVRYDLVTVAVTTVVLVAAVIVVTRVRGTGAGLPSWRTLLPEGVRGGHLVGIGLLVVAILVGLATWRNGLGTLATPSQEHDAVTHALVTANIARTGDALPSQVSPSDLLTGGADNFYPAGMHALSALLAVFGVSPVGALNAMTIVLFAVVLPVGLVGLATVLRPGSTGLIIGGGAAVASAVSYRPVYAMMHDGGIYANAAAVGLTPALVALLLVVGLGARAEGTRSALVDPREVLVVALAVVGAFWVHPTAAPLVGLTFGCWWLVDRIAARPGWRVIGSQLVTVGVGSVVAVVLAIPVLAAGAGMVSTVADWSRDSSILPFPATIGRLLGFPYAGYLDPAVLIGQAYLTALLLLGIAAAFWYRRYAGLLAAWLAWAVVLGVYLVGATVPVVSQIAGLFFNSFIRIDAAFMIVSWMMVGVGTAAVWSMARWLGTALPVPRVSAATRALALGATAMVLVSGVLVRAYVPMNSLALENRFLHSELLRVTEDDRAAFDWLAGRVGAGERIMNSANDGSTFLYVYEGLPVVNTFPLGSANLPYSIPLLTRFNRIDTDQDVRDMVREQNIRWVYVDLDAPPIFVPPEYRSYLDGDTFTVPPGLLGLEDVDSVHEVFRSGTVRVYRVDDAVFAE